jgi:hypothetical protein
VLFSLLGGLQILGILFILFLALACRVAFFFFFFIANKMKTFFVQRKTIFENKTEIF